jgi:hypothetical protein
MEYRLAQQAESFESKLSHMISRLDAAKIERDVLADRLNELEVGKFRTKEHRQKYMDNVRQCCIELLSLNVGLKQVEPVIKSVLHNIASMDIRRHSSISVYCSKHAC